MSAKQNSGNSNNNKNGKKKIRFGMWVKAFFIALIILFLIAVLGGFIMLFGIVSNAKAINPTNIEAMLNESSFIYDSSGTVTEKIQANAYRTVVPVEQIPEDLLNAFIAIEDKRFLEHNGIDFTRLVGVTLKGLKQGEFTQGASTITMQLSKNLFTSTEKSLTRKVTDMYYAIEIEKQLTKTEILHAYVNTVFLGGDSNGVQAAAKSYFNKDVSELNLAESAMIAGITQYPSLYIPFKTEDISPDEDVTNLQIKLYPRADNAQPTEGELIVDDKLRNAGLIDSYEYIMLKKGSLYVQKASLNEKSVERQRVVLAMMREQELITESEYQEALNTDIIIQFPPRIGQGISTYFNDMVKQEVISILVSQGSTEEEALNKLKNGGLKIYSTMDTRIQKVLEKEFSNHNNFPGNYTDDDGIIQPQASMVIIDQHTGHVVAMMGGRDQAGRFIYNRSTSPRQPGSSIKPIAVYLPAIEKGLNPNDKIKDEPRKDPTNPKGYWPSNINNKYYGQITYQKALEVSSNVVAVGLLERLEKTPIESINYSLNRLEEMGITTLVRSTDSPYYNDENLSLALGGMTTGVTPFDMAKVYSGIANGGTLVKPSFITKIEDSSGNEIYVNEAEEKVIAEPHDAYTLTQMLVGVMNNGFAKGSRVANQVTAAKTGTTDDDKDYWFTGYTPYYTAALWIGSDEPREMSGGSIVAARLWKKVMDGVHQDLPRIEFDVPQGAKKIVEEHSIVTEVEEPEPEIIEPEDTLDVIFGPEENNTDNEQNGNDGNNAQRNPENQQNPPTNNENQGQNNQNPPANNQNPTPGDDLTQPSNPVLNEEVVTNEPPPPVYEDIPPRR